MPDYQIDGSTLDQQIYDSISDSISEFKALLDQNDESIVDKIIKILNDFFAESDLINGLINNDFSDSFTESDLINYRNKFINEFIDTFIYELIKQFNAYTYNIPDIKLREILELIKNKVDNETFKTIINQNITSGDNFTLLHLAVQKEYTNTVKMLIESGANLKAEDIDGQTPLHLAAENGNIEICKNLKKIKIMMGVLLYI